jgi:hypothetical protein
MQIQANQGAVLIREVADHLLQRSRKVADQGRNGHDLVVAGNLRVFQQVNHLDLVFVLAVKVLFADALQVPESAKRLGRLPRHVEAQAPYVVVLLAAIRLLKPVGACS